MCSMKFVKCVIMDNVGIAVGIVLAVFVVQSRMYPVNILTNIMIISHHI